MPEYTTTTVENLHSLLPAPQMTTVQLLRNGQRTQRPVYPPMYDVEIRLRTASPWFMPLGYIRKGARYEIAVKADKNNPRGAVYLPVEGTRLIDVKNYQIPEHLQVHPRGWKDMRLEDLDTPYKEERP